jgi:hypothetical protein
MRSGQSLSARPVQTEWVHRARPDQQSHHRRRQTTRSTDTTGRRLTMVDLTPILQVQLFSTSPRSKKEEANPNAETPPKNAPESLLVVLIYRRCLPPGSIALHWRKRLAIHMVGRGYVVSSCVPVSPPPASRKESQRFRFRVGGDGAMVASGSGPFSLQNTIAPSSHPYSTPAKGSRVSVRERLSSLCFCLLSRPLDFYIAVICRVHSSRHGGIVGVIILSVIVVARVRS